MEHIADENSDQTITRLKETIRHSLGRYISPSDRIALLDFPDHANVGDSAIWLGELAYFKDAHGLVPSFVCPANTAYLDDLQKTLPSGPIFLHGGGNFGDIWPTFQIFREAVLKRFPGRLIVQLPQTIHFEDREGIARTAEAIKAHDNFVLLVRDERSLKIATDNFRCAVHLCPDMAFYLGSLSPIGLPKYDLLCLLRTDKEKALRPQEPHQDMPFNTHVEDWLDEEPELYAKLRRKMIFKAILSSRQRTLDSNKQRQFLYKALAEHRVRRGLRMLSSGRFIVTDRLHAHILSTLLDIPHVVFDNVYGKLTTFIDAWTKSCTTSEVASNFETALQYYQKHMKT